MFWSLFHEIGGISLCVVDKYHPQLVRFVFVDHVRFERQINVFHLQLVVRIIYRLNPVLNWRAV